MFGAVATYLSLRISSVVKHYSVVYGLMALAAVLVIAAGAWAVHSIYLLLTFRFGTIAASLMVAGGLLAISGALVVLVTWLQKRRPTALADRLGPAPFVAYPRRRVRSGTLVAGAGVALISALGALVASALRGSPNNGDPNHTLRRR